MALRKVKTITRALHIFYLQNILPKSCLFLTKNPFSTLLSREQSPNTMVQPTFMEIFLCAKYHIEYFTEIVSLNPHRLKYQVLRQSGTWGPLPSSAYTWTNISLSNKVKRNYKRLNITARMPSQGKLRASGYKKTRNPTATSEELGAKSRVLCMPPKPPLWPNSGTQEREATPGKGSGRTGSFIFV